MWSAWASAPTARCTPRQRMSSPSPIPQLTLQLPPWAASSARLTPTASSPTARAGRRAQYLRRRQPEGFRRGGERLRPYEHRRLRAAVGLHHQRHRPGYWRSQSGQLAALYGHHRKHAAADRVDSRRRGGGRQRPTSTARRVTGFTIGWNAVVGATRIHLPVGHQLDLLAGACAAADATTGRSVGSTLAICGEQPRSAGQHDLLLAGPSLQNRLSALGRRRRA